MTSHRLRRRTFLTALSGGIGLKVMLRNMEMSAQTVQSPPRFLVTYWPLAIIPGQDDALWTPSAGAAGGYALQTFADNGLAGDMITLRGITTTGIRLNGGGAREGGLVALVTGADCGGTRTNRGEPDDAFASGPSIDQLLLKNVPALRSTVTGPGYANSICDLRTDLGELAPKCLSYANEKHPVTTYGGDASEENIPLMATMSPLDQYTNLFSALVPTAMSRANQRLAAPQVADQMLTQLASQRSVLDFALTEINQLKGMVPSEARGRLQNHYDAVHHLETDLTSAIHGRYPTVGGTGGSAGGVGGASGAGGLTGAGGLGGNAGAGGAPGGRCSIIPARPTSIQGTPDWTSGAHGNYGTPKRESTDDIATHRTVGALHMDILRAAFVCDIIRCGTFQWAPGVSHVGFKGMYPGDELGIYQHHALAGAVGSGTPNVGTTPDALTVPQIRCLFNVERWYFARHAENLNLWKDTIDGFGNPLLDSTIIPFVTETTDFNDGRGNMPGMIFGGKKLGMTPGQYKKGNFPVGSLWGTIAQAFGYEPNAPPLAAPIPGLWSKPTGA